MSTESTADGDAQLADTNTPSDSEGVKADTTLAPEDDDDNGPVVIDHAPPRLSQIVASGAGLVGAGLTAPFALLALPFGLAGVVMVATSLFVAESRRWLSVGVALIFAGTLISGAFGAVQPELMLLSVTSTILAWDIGHQAFSLGDQLGRNTPTRRLEITHMATSAVALGVVSFVAYFVFLFSGDGRPAPAVALLVLGIVVMGWMFRS